MENTNWLKQAKGSPLFEDVLWLRPENAHQRPKVLLIGGSSHGFAEVTKLYQLIKSKSAYQTKVLLPKSLEKILGSALSDTVFVEATSSGEIAQTALNEIRSAYDWAEVVIFNDDIGNNSQTEVLISGLLEKFDKPTFFMGRAMEIIRKSATNAVANPNVIFLGNLSEVSKFVSNTDAKQALLHSDGIVRLLVKLHAATLNWPATFIFNYESQIIVCQQGKIAVTKSSLQDGWELEVLAKSAEFGKIFENKKFEALVTGVYLSLA